MVKNPKKLAAKAREISNKISFDFDSYETLILGYSTELKAKISKMVFVESEADLEVLHKLSVIFSRKRVEVTDLKISLGKVLKGLNMILEEFEKRLYTCEEIVGLKNEPSRNSMVWLWLKPVMKKRNNVKYLYDMLDELKWMVNSTQKDIESQKDLWKERNWTYRNSKF